MDLRDPHVTQLTQPSGSYRQRRRYRPIVVILVLGVAVAVAVLVAILFWGRWHSVDISGDAVTRASRYEIEAPKNVSVLLVAVSGYVDGRATITIMESKATWRSLSFGPGKVGTDIGTGLINK